MEDITMRLIHFTALHASALCVCAALNHAALAQAHGDFCDLETAVPKPILNVSDFNGDGTVTSEDVRLVSRQARSGEYIAFYDRNADYVVDLTDVMATLRELHTHSTLLDQQLAAVFWETERYRDQATAIAEGYIPFTQSFFGHGSHWARHPENGTLDYHFEASNPEGLNYDSKGNLWAVFYYFGATPPQPDGTLYPPKDAFNPLAGIPGGFVGEKDEWHHHAGACLLGVNYQDPEMNPENLSFLQCLSPSECAQQAQDREYRWTAKFHMVHLWLYELNPCGTFANAHPLLATDSPHPDTTNPTGEACNTLDPHAEFPFVLGTLCDWLKEIGETPDYCPTYCAR